MRPVLVLIALFMLAVPTMAADPAAVAKIHGGIVDCVDCDLRAADLANTCVKEHDLHGADFSDADASLMCMSFADFTGARFRGTDLSGAKTSITSFLGTDLRRVKGLTQKQLDVACGDAATKLPPGLHVHTC